MPAVASKAEEWRVISATFSATLLSTSPTGIMDNPRLLAASNNTYVAAHPQDRIEVAGELLLRGLVAIDYIVADAAGRFQDLGPSCPLDLTKNHCRRKGTG